MEGRKRTIRERKGKKSCSFGDCFAFIHDSRGVRPSHVSLNLISLVMTYFFNKLQHLSNSHILLKVQYMYGRRRIATESVM